jgi:transaldolase
MNALQQLSKYGQSYWLDNLTRDMIRNGELKSRIASQNLRGVTSNPAIFHKAITGSAIYDEQIAQLAGTGASAEDIYEALVVKDVQEACDVLRPVYDASDATDGFVSLEVSPLLACDTAGTMEETRRLWQAVNRPNLCVKIPGTPSGVPAIEEMIYEGININVTLLFSVADYDAVAHAYMSGLERRAAEGNPLGQVASVASFFLSRVDVLIDQLLTHRIRPQGSVGYDARPAELLGKAALASAKLAYQHFKGLSSSARWEALAKQGAQVQRLLWASTSTKNPAYSDVYYVEPLIGPHTINTMPDETSSAFAEHGKLAENTIEDGVDVARRELDTLAAVGVDLEKATWQLQHEGVQKFIDPYQALIGALEKKRGA